MRLENGIRYLENVIEAYDAFKANEEFIQARFEKLNFATIFSNIPSVFGLFKEEEKKLTKEDEKQVDEWPYQTGDHKDLVKKRYQEMVKNSYMLLIYCYLTLGSYAKVLEYAKNLKTEFKLSSKMSFELKMYLAEAYIQSGKPNLAFNELKIDQAFEEIKDSQQENNSENFLIVQNTFSGSLEKPLPKQAIMFLNIATCNYFLGKFFISMMLRNEVL